MSFATRWRRLNGPDRVLGVDLARGLAVLGMFAAHLIDIPREIDVFDPSTWDGIVHGRSSILFATLAGVSIALVTGGAVPLRGEAARVARLRLLVRALLLWLIGVLLILTGVPVFVILPAYAILFLLAIPLTGLGARELLVSAAVVAVVMPFIQVLLDQWSFWYTPTGHDLALAIGWHYPFPTWIAFVLAGMGVTRLGLSRTDVQLGMLGIGAVLAAGAALFDPSQCSNASEVGSYAAEVWTGCPHSTGVLEVIGSGGFALAVIGGCLLLCRTALHWVVLPLRATGAMPLTAYVAQLVVWWLVALAVLGDPGDLSGFRALEPFWPLTIAVVVACTLWALLVGRGPLEWAVDATARRLVPATRFRR